MLNAYIMYYIHGGQSCQSDIVRVSVFLFPNTIVKTDFISTAKTLKTQAINLKENKQFCLANIASITSSDA